jgi:isoleucyl-tRNA synthetase
VRVAQQARKQAGLDVTDRVVLTIDAPEVVRAAVRRYEQYIAGEVLSRQVEYTALPDGFAGVVGDGVEVRVAVRPVST